ncbi:MAG: hypothetical protein Q9163_003150 [Psora crenata]
MDSQVFRQAAHSAVDEIIDYFENLRDRRVLSDVEPGYLRKIIPEEPPKDGEEWSKIQKDMEAKIMPGLTHWQHPDFMAYFPTAVTFPSILGELYSASLSAPGSNWQCSPAMTELETIVMDWMAGLLHLPDCFLSKGQGGSVIQGSASESVVTVMVAAMEGYIRRAYTGLTGHEREEKACHLRNRLVALGSDQTHSSPAFQDLLAECKREGLEPFYITVNLGTAVTCAVDDFAMITAVNNAGAFFPPLWIHVDAAYAGSALILEEYAHLSKSFEHIDSFDMNMHKWLLVNFESSCLFVRNRRHLTDVLTVTPSYLRNEYADNGLVTDYRDWQIPLGRRFRSLKIWFVMRTYGIKGMQTLVRRHIALEKQFAAWLSERPDLFHIITPPAFALTVFTVVVSPGEAQQRQKGMVNCTNGAPVRGNLASNDVKPDPDSQRQKRANALTKEVYERINASGKLFLTSSVINGIYAIRFVSANQKPNEQSLRAAFELILHINQEVLGEERN